MLNQSSDDCANNDGWHLNVSQSSACSSACRPVIHATPNRFSDTVIINDEDTESSEGGQPVSEVSLFAVTPSQSTATRGSSPGGAVPPFANYVATDEDNGDAGDADPPRPQRHSLVIVDVSPIKCCADE